MGAGVSESMLVRPLQGSLLLQEPTMVSEWRWSLGIGIGLGPRREPPSALLQPLMRREWWLRNASCHS
jgi:hypothetical protein